MAVTQRPLDNGRMGRREDIRRAISAEPPRHSVREATGRKPYQAARIQAQNRQVLSAIGHAILVLSHIGGALTVAGPNSLDFKAGVAIGGPLLQWSIFGVNIWLALIGVGLQYGVTRIEWHNVRNKKSLRYLGALAVDIYTSFTGFKAPLLLAAGFVLSRLGVNSNSTTGLATILAILVCVGAAVMPEHWLVED